MPRAFSKANLLQLALLSGGGAAAAVLPAQLDGFLADALVWLQHKFRPNETREMAGRMAKHLGRSEQECLPLAEQQLRMRMEDLWGRMRGIGPRRWVPRIELQGEDRVRQALKRGRGAVMWCMRTASATAMKQAFYRAGLPLVHLSSEVHGTGSDTRLAASVLSPMYCRAENPYLAERVVIPLDGSLAYVETIREWLRRNACVSIFGEHTGRQNQEAPLLGGVRKFATGAPSFAWMEDSALFTVYAARTGPFGYRVVIEDEVEVNRSMARKEYAAWAVAEFARRLERVVRLYPADWHAWNHWRTQGPHAS